LVLLLGVMVLFAGLEGFVFPPLYHLCFGWLGFLRRTVPKMELNLDGVGLFLLCAGVLLVVGHFSAAWLAGAISARRAALGLGSAPSWHWRWRQSLILFLAMPTLFLATMAAVGLAHQVAWLATSREPWIERAGYPSELFWISGDLQDWWRAQSEVDLPTRVEELFRLSAQAALKRELDAGWVVPLEMRRSGGSDFELEYLLTFRDFRQRERRGGLHFEMYCDFIDGKRQWGGHPKVVRGAQLAALMERAASMDAGR